AYASYQLKNIFDVNQLDLEKVGRAFGFTVPPNVNINVGEARKSEHRKRKSFGSK
ncbi:ATP-dependent RNA helicase, partial [Coemansia spiralis]